MDRRIADEELEAARAYERLHVPALFREWAPMVADAAKVVAGDRVLDVACGTGVLAREVASRVGPGGFVAGVDPGPGMLAHAAELAPDIEWKAGTAESLPYPDAAFDRVVSQFGLMFFTDRVEALREMSRVLSPGGTMAVAVWDTLENTEPYRIEVALLERLAGRSAAAALSAPFVLGDRAEIAALFEGAGISPVDITTKAGTARFPSVRTMVEADLRGWLPIMGVTLDEDLIQRILEESERELRKFVDKSGQVVFASPAHIARFES